jgi:polyhydroxybutyrate depolymerase
MAIINRLFSLFGHPGQARSLTVNGLKRSYFVHVPPKLDPNRPAAIVLALHGATMNAPMMAWFTGLNEKADEAGFVVVYPNGTGSGSSFTWNAGNCCGHAVKTGVDDVAFGRALLDDLPAVVSVDRNRIFATGMSNGAMMAYRLGAELADRLAAIAPVAGAMATENCNPSRPVSVLHFHGTEDEFAPFAGGPGPRSQYKTDHRSVEETIRLWVQANACSETPAIEEIPDRAGDGTTITRKTYGGGSDGTEVVLVIVHGGGHTWPGQRGRSMVLGRATMNISANDLIWEFVAKHGRA